MDPAFLDFEQVMDLHRASLAAHGGIDGIRDDTGLRSAIHQPQQDYFYGRADLFGIAAAYAFHIAQAQAFFDGNKRTALSSATTFLEANGVNTTADADALYDAMIASAEKRPDKAGLAARFRALFA
jgi:death-on-curing protein